MKTIKSKLTFIIVFSFYSILTTKAQNHFVYDYDASGNRIERHVIPLERISSPDSTEQFSDNLAGHDIKIYPNPTREKLNVQLIGYDKMKQSRIEVYDVTGKLVFSKNSLTEFTTLDLTDKLSGNYFITILLMGKQANGRC